MALFCSKHRAHKTLPTFLCLCSLQIGLSALQQCGQLFQSLSCKTENLDTEMYMMVSTDREADIHNMRLLWLCFCTHRDAGINTLMLLFSCSSSTVSSVCYSFLDGGFCRLVGIVFCLFVTVVVVLLWLFLLLFGGLFS